MQNESGNQGRIMKLFRRRPAIDFCSYIYSCQITADILIDEAVGIDWDLVVLPGGMPGE